MAKNKKEIKENSLEISRDKKFVCLIINEDASGKPTEIQAMVNGINFFEEIGLLEYRLNSLKIGNSIEEAFQNYLNKVTDEFNQLSKLGNMQGATVN